MKTKDRPGLHTVILVQFPSWDETQRPLKGYQLAKGHSPGYNNPGAGLFYRNEETSLETNLKCT